MYKRQENPPSESRDEILQRIEEINEGKSKRDKNRAAKLKAEDWFFDMEDELPSTWLQANFMDVTWLITCGVAKKPDYVSEGVPFLSGQNAKPFKTNFKDIRYITEQDFKTFTVGGKPEPNDILYSRVGSYGEAAKIEFDFDFGIYVSLTLIKPIHEVIDVDYLVGYLNSPLGLMQANGGICGSGIQNLNVGNVRKYRIPIPPLNEQRRIAEITREVVEMTDSMTMQVATLEAELTQLDQSILAKAFRGELVPQDPGDEPASQLLHRIRATREKLEAEKKAAKKKSKKKATRKKNSKV